MKLFFKNRVPILLSILSLFLMFGLIYFSTTRYLLYYLALISLLFIAILLVDNYSNHKKINYVELAKIDLKYFIKNFLHHYILPLLLFFSVSIFIMFNSVYLSLVVVILYALMNMMLFTNIKTFYENDFTLEARTHEIYDTAKILIFFFFSNFILSNFFNGNYTNYLTLFLILALSEFLFAIMLVRRRITKIDAILITISGALVMTIFFIISIILNLRFLHTNIVLLLVFYVFLSIFHHKLTNQLSFKIIAQYLLIVVIAVSFLIGLS